MGLLIIFIVFSCLLVLTLIWKKSLQVSAAVSVVLTGLLNIIFAGSEFPQLLKGLIEGLLVATEISVLVFGALLFFTYLKSRGFIEKLEQSLALFSENKLIIAILLAVFFGSFIEGVSGFGVPAMIVAPLLLSLGFPAYMSASLALLANTIPALFGAAGTPIKVGFAGLPTDQVPPYAALLVLLPAVILPFIFKNFLEHLKLLKDSQGYRNKFLTLSAGLAFAIPFVFFSRYNPAFTSIAASLIGVFIWLLVLKWKGTGLASVGRAPLVQFFITFRPYLLIAALILVSKVLLGDLKFKVSWKAIALERSISFFQPGLLFIAGFIILCVVNTGQKTNIKTVVSESARRIPPTFASLACLAVMARLLSQNLHLGELLATGALPGPLLPMLAATGGFGGSFMAGSATMSNLMFGEEWFTAAHQYGFDSSLLLASQLAGAAAGNALSVQNVAIVQAVLNVKGIEATIYSTLWKPVLLCFALICFAAFCLALYLV
jgi:lactate permease